jgi:hypothetical protein
VAQIDVALSGFQPKKVPLAQDGGNQSGDPTATQRAALQHEMGKTRMLAEPRHGATVRRDGTRRLERTEIDQQGARRGKRRRRRRRQPGQSGFVFDTPCRHFERQGRQVGVEDLGRREGHQAALRLFGP